MGRQARVSEKRVRWSLIRNGGNVVATAGEIGISRQALHQRLKKKPTLQSILYASRLDRLPALEGTVRTRCFLKYFKLLSQLNGCEPERRSSCRPRFSDADIEGLIAMRGGDIMNYRDLMWKSGEVSGRFYLSHRHDRIARCAGKVLGIAPDRVWKAFAADWLLYLACKELDREIERRRRLKEAPEVYPKDKWSSSNAPALFRVLAAISRRQSVK